MFFIRGGSWKFRKFYRKTPILRTSILKNIWERLLLPLEIKNISASQDEAFQKVILSKSSPLDKKSRCN